MAVTVYSKQYLRSLSPLTAVEIEAACIGGVELQWHPDYEATSLDDCPPFKLTGVRRDQDLGFEDSCYIVETVGGAKVAVCASGRTPSTHKSVFLNYVVPPEPAPRNNDGREACWWCQGKTRKAGDYLQYDICTQCGR